MKDGALLNDKVVLITGAGAGIGRASALLFAREGAQVACVDRDEKSLQQLLDEITKAEGRRW